jgi:hypothetical protein
MKNKKLLILLFTIIIGSNSILLNAKQADEAYATQSSNQTSIAQQLASVEDAAEAGDFDYMQRLLIDEENTVVVDRALLVATNNGHNDIVQLILQHASPSAEGVIDALFCATSFYVESTTLDIIAILHHDPRIINVDQELIEATRRNKPDIVRILSNDPRKVSVSAIAEALDIATAQNYRTVIAELQHACTYINEYRQYTI